MNSVTPESARGGWLRLAVKAVIPESQRRRFREFQRQRRDLQSFKAHLRPDDVFLVGHPKSGNTWLAFMLAIAMEERFAPRKVNLGNIGAFFPSIHARDSWIRDHESLPSPRIFRNEGPVYPDLYPRTIYILRDPRAALVSYYHHCVHDAPDYPWRLSEFLEEILAHGCIQRAEPHLIRWDKQVLDWTRRGNSQPVHIVPYEAMKKDRRKVLIDTLEFLGLKCSPETIAEAVERSSFENMRKEEETFGAEPYSGTKGERGYFMRKGSTNGWKEELSPEMARRIETEFAGAMKLYGYL